MLETRRPTRPIDQASADSQEELVGGREARVPGQDHHVMLPQAAGEPFTQGGAAKVVEGRSLSVHSREDRFEIPGETRCSRAETTSDWLLQ